MSQSQSVYDDAIFFENDDGQIENVKSICPSINIVKIADTAHVPTTSYNNDPLRRYILSNLLQTNLYLYIVVKLLRSKGEMFDTISGIQEKQHLSIFMDWLLKKSKDAKKRAALFDWDRTITMFEGIHITNTANTMEEMKREYSRFIYDPKLSQRDLREDALQFLCGGPNRIRFLRDMFEALHENGVDIIILSNNGACGTPIFEDLIRGLIPKNIPFKVIASRHYHCNKGLALVSQPEFQQICKNKEQISVQKGASMVKKSPRKSVSYKSSPTLTQLLKASKLSGGKIQKISAKPLKK